MASGVKIVEVPGIGNVEFPAEMDDAAISQALSAQTQNSIPTEQLQRSVAPDAAPAGAGLLSGGGALAPDESMLHGVARQGLGGIGRGIKGIVSSLNPLNTIEANAREAMPVPGESGLEKAYRLGSLSLAPLTGGVSQKVLSEGVYGLGKNLLGRARAGDIGAITEAGAIAAAPKIAEGVTRGASKIASATRPTRVGAAASILETIPGRAVKLNKSPGEAIVNEGVPVSATKRGLLKSVGEMKQTRGKEIGETYRKSAPASPENLDSILDPVVQGLKQNAGTPEAVARAKRAQAYVDELKANQPGPLDLEKLHKLKTELGKTTKWDKEDVSFNDVKQDLTRVINDRLEQRIPGVKGLQGRYGNIETYKGDLTKRVEADRGRSFFPSRGEGIITGLIDRVPGSTLAKTLGARMLAGPEPLAAPQIPAPMPPFRPTGLLGKGGLEVKVPTGEPNPVAESTQGHQLGYLPEPSPQLGLQVLEAEPQIYREPGTGKMRRGYKSTPKRKGEHE